MTKLNLVRLTLDVPYSKTDATITATTSTKYRKGQDDTGVAQYYDLGDSGALLWTAGRMTVKEKSGKRVAVVAIDGVTHNGTTTDGRNKYILTVDTADDGSTLMTGLKQNDNGTNSVTNVDSDLAVDQFPEGSTAEITWDTSGQNLLEDSFNANSSTDTATAGETLAARKAVAIDSTDSLLYLFDDGNANHTLVGITDADYAISNTATYIRGGGRSTGHTGLTAGVQQFASTSTAGAITETNTGYPLGRASADGTAINVDLSSQADPAIDIDVTTGTSTDLFLYTPAQLKLAAETHSPLGNIVFSSYVNEVVAVGDILGLITQKGSGGVGSVNNWFGRVTNEKRIATAFISNGGTATDFECYIKKVGSPTDNAVCRIETDSSGEPSGTLADANLTASVAGTSLTTDMVNRTFTFASPTALTKGQIYWVVFERSGSLDSSNMYEVGASNASATSTAAFSRQKRDDSGGWVDAYATTLGWGMDNNAGDIYWANVVLLRTGSTLSDYTKATIDTYAAFAGIAQEAGSGYIDCLLFGKDINQSGLTVGTESSWVDISGLAVSATEYLVPEIKSYTNLDIE